MRIPLIVAALICLCIGPSLALTYEMHDLGTVGLNAINNHGQIVGVMGGTDGQVHAFSWQNGQTTDLGLGDARGVNDLGQVAFYSGPDNSSVASIWQGGVITRIEGVAPRQDGSLTIDNQGQVIGTTTLASVTQGWIWQGGILTYLGTMGDAAGSAPLAINNLGQVIGYTVSSNNYLASPFMWQGGAMSSIPGLPEADWLAAINDSGEIVGDDWILDESYRAWTEAFIFQNGSRTFLGNLSTPTAYWRLSHATDINNAGQVVGWASAGDSGEQSHAFVWQDGLMTDLGTLGGQDSRANAINDLGWIVGWSETVDGQVHGVLWTPAPEPPSIVIILAGLSLIFGLCLRDKRNATR